MIARPVMEVTAGLTFPLRAVSEIEVRSTEHFFGGQAVFGVVRVDTADNTQFVLLSTSKVKRKLPVHPMVPTSTSPAFSCEGLSRASWKKGDTNILARAPNFVSITFCRKPVLFQSRWLRVPSHRKIQSGNTCCCSSEALMKHTCKVSQASSLHG